MAGAIMLSLTKGQNEKIRRVFAHLGPAASTVEIVQDGSGRITVTSPMTGQEWKIGPRGGAF